MGCLTVGERSQPARAVAGQRVVDLGLLPGGCQEQWNKESLYMRRLALLETTLKSSWHRSHLKCTSCAPFQTGCLGLQAGARREGSTGE